MQSRHVISRKINRFSVCLLAFKISTTVHSMACHSLGNWLSGIQNGWVHASASVGWRNDSILLMGCAFIIPQPADAASAEHHLEARHCLHRAALLHFPQGCIFCWPHPPWETSLIGPENSPQVSNTNFSMNSLISFREFLHSSIQQLGAVWKEPLISKIAFRKCQSQSCVSTLPLGTGNR